MRKFSRTFFLAWNTKWRGVTDITHNKEMENLTFKRSKVNFNMGEYTTTTTDCSLLSCSFRSLKIIQQTQHPVLTLALILKKRGLPKLIAIDFGLELVNIVPMK